MPFISTDNLTTKHIKVKKYSLATNSISLTFHATSVSTRWSSRLTDKLQWFHQRSRPSFAARRGRHSAPAERRFLLQTSLEIVSTLSMPVWNVFSEKGDASDEPDGWISERVNKRMKHSLLGNFKYSLRNSCNSAQENINNWSGTFTSEKRSSLSQWHRPWLYPDPGEQLNVLLECLPIEHTVVLPDLPRQKSVHGVDIAVRNTLLNVCNSPSLFLLTSWQCVQYIVHVSLHRSHQGSPTWCPRAPGRPHGPHRSPAGLFWQ